jgi:hypothetical protein
VARGARKAGRKGAKKARASKKGGGTLVGRAVGGAKSVISKVGDGVSSLLGRESEPARTPPPAPRPVTPPAPRPPSSPVAPRPPSMGGGMGGGGEG